MVTQWEYYGTKDIGTILQILDKMEVQLIAYIIIIVWGVGTTIYGLYLSRRNNEKYNKKIIELLEEIKENGKKENN